MESIDNAVSHNNLISLEQLCVRAVEFYPRLPNHYANEMGNSLIRLAASFHRRVERMAEFTHCVVSQSLMRTCSRQITASTTPTDEIDEESVLEDSRAITHMSYVPLWKTLLGVVSFPYKSKSIRL